MYLCSLKQLFWKKCAFIVHIIMLFKPKVHNKVSILKFVDSDFYFLILWVFNICLYKWNLESSKAHLRHVFIKSNTQIFMTQYLFYKIVSYQWKQKQRALDTFYYVDNHYAMLKSLNWILHRTNRKHKKLRKIKNSFPKDLIESVDL